MLHPSNLITDYLLAIVALVLAARLWKAAKAGRSTGLYLWSLGYVGVAAAALAGGTYHGFYDSTDTAVANALWKASVYAVGLTGLMMLSGTIATLVAARLRTAAYGAALLKFLVFAWWMLEREAFVYALLDLGIAIAVIVVLYLWHAGRTGDRAAVQVAVAFAIASIGAVLQQLGVSLHRHFDHNDVYHVVQIVALIVLARALRRGQSQAPGVGPGAVKWN